MISKRTWPALHSTSLPNTIKTGYFQGLGCCSSTPQWWNTAKSQRVSYYSAATWWTIGQEPAETAPPISTRTLPDLLDGHSPPPHLGHRWECTSRGGTAGRSCLSPTWMSWHRNGEASWWGRGRCGSIPSTLSRISWSKIHRASPRCQNSWG